MIPYTDKEVREKLYNHLRALCHYWSKVNSSERTEYERMEGLCFSILNIFDGSTNLPAMDIVLAPHASDKDYYISLGEKYFEKGMVINDCHMHEEFFK